MNRLPDSTLPLDFSRPVDPAPAASVDDVERVVAVLETPETHLTPEELAKANGWMTAAQIARALGTGYNDRKVRRVASAAAPRIVSYPGSPGYRLFQHCTLDELNHGIDAMRSQARDMVTRSALYERALHRRQRFQGSLSDPSAAAPSAGREVQT